MFENFEGLSGIYCITNLHNNKKYIGKAKNMQKRFSEHYRTLNNNYHKNKHLQRSWNNNKNVFIFQPLYILNNYTDKLANKYEIYFINLLKTYNKKYGYNKTLGGDGGDTFSYVSDEEKKRRKKVMSDAKKGKIFTEEHKQKISDALMGNTNGKGCKGIKKPSVSDDTRKKLSNSLKGRKFSDEHRKHLSEAQKGEKNHSWKKYARVVKRGFTKSGQQKYSVIYQGKYIKTSIFKEKMDKLAKEINKSDENMK